MCSQIRKTCKRINFRSTEMIFEMRTYQFLSDNFFKACAEKCNFPENYQIDQNNSLLQSKKSASIRLFSQNCSKIEL